MAAAPTAAARPSRPRRLARLGWAAVAALFLLSAVIVPTLAPVATTDDWAYARSAEILLRDGRLRIFPVVAASAVFPVVWGAGLGALLGPSLGVFRLSTVLLAAVGGVALYALLRALGVSRGGSALGMAAHLFNPLAFALAFTFMTDAFFTALLVLACLGYVRGLDGEASSRWTLAGSAAAAAALLTRQQGVLVPLAVAAFLLATGRLGRGRAALASLLRVGGLPLVAAVGYALWLRLGNDVPKVQQAFLREALGTGIVGAGRLAARLAFVELAYLGFFLLPVAAALLPALPTVLRGIGRNGWRVVALWASTLAAGVAITWPGGQRMPYVQQFFGTGGLGPPDVLGSRPHVLGPAALDALTLICVAASLAVALLAGRASSARSLPRGDRAGLLLAIGIGQVVGVLPPSFHYLNRGGTLDRYLLPLLPLGLALALWATSGLRLALPLGWAVVTFLALFAVAGTRDYLTYMDAVWSLAARANAAGVPNDRLDAGSAWDGYHLYEASLATPGPARTPPPRPWWVSFYAPLTTSDYVVTSRPQHDYVDVWRVEAGSLLGRGPTPLLLQRRPDAPWPPTPAPAAGTP